MTLSIFVYICPPHCERNSAHIVRTFPSSFRFVFDIVAHNVVGKSKILQYVGVRSFSQFLIIFIVHSIQFFIVSSKISKFLKLDQNWRFYDVFSMELFSLRKNSFFLEKYLPKCEGIVSKIPMSSDIVSHNVSGILFTLHRGGKWPILFRSI